MSLAFDDEIRRRVSDASNFGRLLFVRAIAQSGAFVPVDAETPDYEVCMYIVSVGLLIALFVIDTMAR
jgi:hypothetical protein